MSVRFESTPNPQTLRFSADRVFADRSVEFRSPTDAQHSSLPKKLFGFPWCAGVFVGRDFVTITKQEWVDWDIIAEPLAHLIQEHLESGQPILAPSVGVSVADENDVSDESDAVRTIKQVLETEIRPMVAQDGGDVTFVRFESGVVYLRLQGSCAGCPSSTMTLKMGIESRLRDAVPDVHSVEAV